MRVGAASVMAVLMLAWSAGRVDAGPAAPANLIATVSGDTIFLVWSAPPTAIFGYSIEAGLRPGSTIANRIVGPTPTGFTATAIPPGTYYIRVYALDATGISAASNEVVAVVNGAGCAAAPAPPTNLTADVNGSVVTLTWTPGSGGCPATSYILQAGSSPGASNLAVVTLPVTVLGTAAPPGVYYIRVLAQNGALVSAPSSEIVVTVDASAPPPGGPVP